MELVHLFSRLISKKCNLNHFNNLKQVNETIFLVRIPRQSTYKRSRGGKLWNAVLWKSNRFKPVILLAHPKALNCKRREKNKRGFNCSGWRKWVSTHVLHWARHGDSSLNQMHTAEVHLEFCRTQPYRPRQPFSLVPDLEATPLSGLDDIWITRRDSWVKLRLGVDLHWARVCVHGHAASLEWITELEELGRCSSFSWISWIFGPIGCSVSGPKARV